MIMQLIVLYILWRFTKAILVGWSKTWSWTDGAKASEWYFEPVDEAEAQLIIEEYAPYKDKFRWMDEFRNMIAESKPLLEEAKDLIDTASPLITNASQLSSPCSDSAEGQHIEYLIDGNTGTFWHTDWHSEYQDEAYHYLQVELVEDVTTVAFQFTRRQADNDHVTLWNVYGADENDESSYGEAGGVIAPERFKDTTKMYVTAYNDWWQIQYFDGHWGAQTEIGVATGLNNGNNINSGIYNLAEHNGAIEIPVTATLKEQLTTLTDWGYCWIVQGEGIVITKIAVTHYTVLEQTLWSGELDFGSWSINWQVGDGTAGASNPNMFVDAGLKAGMTLRLYVDAYNDWWQVQFFDGHWGAQAEIGTATGLNNGNNVNAGIYNLAEHNGAIEIPVTETLATQLTTLNDWGYCWILQGENCKATKITIE